MRRGRVGLAVMHNGSCGVLGCASARAENQMRRRELITLVGGRREDADLLVVRVVRTHTRKEETRKRGRQ